MIINEKLIEVISDVIVRRNDHDQYGTKENAIKAFRKRYKNLSDNCDCNYDEDDDNA